MSSTRHIALVCVAAAVLTGCRQIPFMTSTSSNVASAPDAGAYAQALQITLSVKLPLAKQGTSDGSAATGVDTVLFRVLSTDGQGNPVYTTVATPSIDPVSGVATAMVPGGYALDVYHTAANGRLVSEQVVPPIQPNVSAALAAGIDTPAITLPPSGELSTLMARIAVSMIAGTNPGPQSDPGSAAFDFTLAARTALALRYSLVPASGGAALPPNVDWNNIGSGAANLAAAILAFEAQQSSGYGRQEDLALAIGTGNNVLAGMTSAAVLTAKPAPTYTALWQAAITAQTQSVTTVFRTVVQTSMALLSANLPSPLQLPMAKSAAASAALNAILTSVAATPLSTDATEWLLALVSRQLGSLTDPAALFTLATSGFTGQDPTSALVTKLAADFPGTDPTTAAAQATTDTSASFAQLPDADQTATATDWLALMGLDPTRSDLVTAVKTTAKTGFPHYSPPADGTTLTAANITPGSF